MYINNIEKQFKNTKKTSTTRDPGKLDILSLLKNFDSNVLTQFLGIYYVALSRTWNRGLDGDESINSLELVSCVGRRSWRGSQVSLVPERG